MERHYFVSVHNVSVLKRGCIERWNSRLVKAETDKITEVNDHREEKHHEEVGRSGRTRNNALFL